jgi:hypothetical protein
MGLLPWALARSIWPREQKEIGAGAMPTPTERLRM